MKSKNKTQFILNIKIFLILFIFISSQKVFANEKNFVIATIDRSPITYFDLKQKAKLIHFLKTKNNQYKNLNKYFDSSLESLISQKLLIKKAIEFNKNNIEDFLGKSHTFVELAKKYDHNWDIERDLVGITIKL